MLENVVAEILAQTEPMQVLALCTKEELALLKALPLPVETDNTYLSMQHLCSRQAIVADKTIVLAITPNEDLVTEAERALIYAMLVRCRKVISCRDKLEDMLKYDDREGWYSYKHEYETKVLDLYKATWRDRNAYPYNIVDNIKEYNKEEGYILKTLYEHLSERKPGKINPGDVEMTKNLQRMFSDISIALLRPKIVLVGNVLNNPELNELVKIYSGDASVKVVKFSA